MTRLENGSRQVLGVLSMAGLVLAAARCSGGDASPPTAITGAVAQVTVTPAAVSLVPQGNTTLRAAAYDQAGNELTGQSFSWTSSSGSVASVSAEGVVTGVGAGTSTITASASGRQGTSQVTVTQASTSTGTITVNGTQQYQTMTGWEALMEIGQAGCDPRAYATYKAGLLDRAANEVGINRIRIGLRNGFENPVDSWAQVRSGALPQDQWKFTWFQVVNDNNDPQVMNSAGFNWGYLDYTIDELVLPLKQRLAARGEDLWLNFSYTGANSGQLHRDNPAEYAELVLAAWLHMKQKYGFTPNSLEIVNEPEVGGWTSTPVGLLLVAAKQRLNAAGFFPDFIGPSATNISGTIMFFDQIIGMPGVATALNEIVYHRYSPAPTAAQLTGLAQRAAQRGMRTAMLEHIGSGYEDLHEDLTLANVSSWQQFGLGFCGDTDVGGVYFPIYGAAPGSNTPDVRTGSRTRFLRQYFRFVGLGAVRVGATSGNSAMQPVAFRNKNGKYTVVVRANAAGSFTVGGLPAGTYAIDYTTSSEYMRSLQDVTITGSQAISTSIPAVGVLTIHAK